ncbi:hypothetical protein CDAR_1131 [Caerostris darwini]|uniref:Ycf15 n=1 Tax=Caerostris darwini TaxID=1538125 RepID=A0AAV4SQ03_9ARAC|nr:hypothetical protein CDAR_941 [Caerostris darwini]GIY35308.1 hypothetical protein CDAR_1131 [Caerostris darwini]
MLVKERLGPRQKQDGRQTTEAFRGFKQLLWTRSNYNDRHKESNSGGRHGTNSWRKVLSFWIVCHVIPRLIGTRSDILFQLEERMIWFPFTFSYYKFGD